MPWLRKIKEGWISVSRHNLNNCIIIGYILLWLYCKMELIICQLHLYRWKSYLNLSKFGQSAASWLQKSVNNIIIFINKFIILFLILCIIDDSYISFIYFLLSRPSVVYKSASLDVLLSCVNFFDRWIINLILLVSVQSKLKSEKDDFNISIAIK